MAFSSLTVVALAAVTAALAFGFSVSQITAHDSVAIESESEKTCTARRGADQTEGRKEEGDVLDYQMGGFIRSGVHSLSWSGFPDLSTRFFERCHNLLTMMMSVERQVVTVLNARKRELSYDRVGFTILRLKHEITDWDNKDQLAGYKDEVEALVRQLHPRAKRIRWRDFLKRGGAGVNPPARQPHLDYYQNWDVWRAAVRHSGEEVKEEDLSNEEPDLILGVWRPVGMTNHVLNDPLALMDASDFHRDQMVPLTLEMTHLGGQGKRVGFKTITANIHHHPKQQWYYYPRQTMREILLFRHYTKGQFFANPHTAIKLGDLPAGADTRKSLETRLFVYFDERK